MRAYRSRHVKEAIGWTLEVTLGLLGWGRSRRRQAVSDSALLREFAVLDSKTPLPGSSD